MSYPEISVPDLVNFLMLTGTNIAYVDGARTAGGKELVRALLELHPDAILYTPLGKRSARCVLDNSGAVVGGDAGLDIGQAHLGVLDFLEQCPVNQMVVIDRSPLSSMVFEPDDVNSLQEVKGFLHRIARASIRCSFMLTTMDPDAFIESTRATYEAEQVRYAQLVNEYLMQSDTPMNIYDVHRKFVEPRKGYQTDVHPLKLTTRWQYK